MAETAFSVTVLFTGEANEIPTLPDYTGSTTTLNFGAGVTGVTVDVTTIDDFYYENDEDFTISIVSVSTVM